MLFVGHIMRILVIDDDEGMRRLLSKALEAAGHEAVLAADGNEGVKQQRLHPADIIITDLFMPNRDGIETISEIRKRFPKVPIVAMSGMSIADTMFAVARQIGANSTLFKPFNLTELQAAIDKAAQVAAKH